MIQIDLAKMIQIDLAKGGHRMITAEENAK